MADTKNSNLSEHMQHIWQPVVQTLDWHQPPETYWLPSRHERLDGTWFPGATIDPLWNLLGRHQPTASGHIAFHWEGEPGDRQTMTYGELEREVALMTSVLRDFGIQPDDTVALYTGWLPETVVTLLACIGLGAQWSIVPLSVHSEALAERLTLIAPKVFVTQDGAWRHGTVLPLKNRADDALGAADSVEHTIVIKRTGINVPWFTGDHWYHELMSGRANTSPSYAQQDTAQAQPISTVRRADSILCSMQVATSNTTPALTRHSTATVLVRAASFQQAVATGGPLWCAGNIAWVVSTWNGLLGPLLSGQEAVLFEGTLDVPSTKRGWEIMHRYSVETLITPPSVMRMIRSWTPQTPPSRHDLSLTRVVTAGEAVEPELRAWMEKTFGGLNVEVLDAWGQVMIGGIAHLQGGTTQLPHISPRVIDDYGFECQASGTGELVLTYPVPGMVSGIVDIDGVETPLENYDRYGPNTFSTSDMVTVDEDSLIHHGRSDSLVSMVGQLTSLDAIRRVLLDHPFVRRAEATVLLDSARKKNIIAAVELHTYEGSTSEAASVPHPGPVSQAPTFATKSFDIADEIIGSVQNVLGGLAAPQTIVFVDKLPKNAQTVLGNLTADQLPTDIQAVYLTWQEISDRAQG